jgi:hypothetical protein
MHVRKLLLPMAILLGPGSLTTAVARAAPVLHTDRSCYLVGQRVAITGSGFAPTRMFNVALDGVNFGISTTDAQGGFTASLRPGGLGANIVQAADTLVASDGSSTSTATFTITRTTGARILAGTGTASTLMAPFQVWGFRLTAGHPPAVPPARQRVYVHYIGPRNALRTTVAIGRTRGQCGYLKTGLRRVFPFTPARGLWKLQLDTDSQYSRHPTGPVARIAVRVA